MTNELRLKEAASLLAERLEIDFFVAYKRVRRLCESRKITSVKIGGSVLIDKKQFEMLLVQGEQNAE